jgi:transcription elongation factor Elf1
MKLRACPFCDSRKLSGVVDEQFQRRWIVCLDCLAQGPLVGTDDETGAEEVWNGSYLSFLKDLDKDGNPIRESDNHN